MRNFLFRLRQLAGQNDREEAYRAERAEVAAASNRSAVDPRFAGEMAALQREAASILLGTAHLESAQRVFLSLADIAGQGHALVLGGSGAGKTRAVAGIVRQIARRIAKHPQAMGLWLQDHKSEFAALVRELLMDVIDELPSREANRLIDNVVVIDPFSATSLVPMQILRPEPGVPPEVQAYEVTSLIDRLGGAELGVRQDAFLYHLVLLGILCELSLPDVAELLSSPADLVSTAMRCPSIEVRAYFTGQARLAQGSLEGVRARLHRLLRLPATRLMLGAKGSVNFHELLASKLVFVDVGSPPLGCEDIGRFWSGLVTLKLTRAIFERTPEEVARPVAIFIDEWQEGLASGGDIAEHYERVLSMARSRGVSLWLVSQSLAGAAKVSASLPKMVATNTNAQLLFRSSLEDARAMAHLLPVTGRRPREPVAPWDERARSPYLSPSEELAKLTAEVTSLPDRVFYFWNRRRPYPAQLVRAAEVSPRVGEFRSAELMRRLEDGALGVPIAELEKQGRKPDDPDEFRPIGGATGATFLTQPARRPGRLPGR